MTKTVPSIVAILAVVSLYTGFIFTAEKDDATPAVPVETTLPEFVAEPETRSDSVPVFSLRDLNNAIVDIAERANPTVVTITTRQTVRQRYRSPFSYFFNDPRFDRDQEFERTGLGSGVIVSPEGYILTNNHVIDRAEAINVRLYTGEEKEATVVGADPASDVAVLRVEGGSLPAIPLGDSDDLRVGEMVLAIGSPLSERFAHTVSKGIVSAKGRTGLDLSRYENYIQTDAAINPGNSGGALVNMDGELVGINTAIASRTGGNQGLGFAIPINMARTIMESLITDGRVVRGFIGITYGNVDGVMAQALGLDVDYGVVIGDVTPDSPAEEAGLAEGDVLLSMNGEPIRDGNRFATEVAGSAPGTEIEFEVYRDGNRKTLTLVLGDWPDEDTVAGLSPGETEELEEALGFRVETLTDNLRRELRLSGNVDGVIVTEIRQNSHAYRQGLRSRDVITQVQNQPITSGNEFYGIIRELSTAGQAAAMLRINRGGQNAFIAFELP